MTKPNFFILGAPKCGTTSLATWLSKHPDAFVCDPKEPRFFNTDWVAPFRPADDVSYERLFERAVGRSAVGEATTGYLVSDVAVRQILGYRPDARFVVSLRNPVDLFFSLHAQRLKEGMESLADPSSAWSAQKIRNQGRSIPMGCHEPKLLCYDRYCRLAEQMERLFAQVDPSHVHVVLLEDLRDDPDTSFKRLCAFLDVQPLSLGDYSAENQRGVPHSILLSQFMRIFGIFRKKVGLPAMGLGEWVRRVNRVSIKRKEDPVFRARLTEHFSEEVTRLERLLSRDLSHWRETGHAQVVRQPQRRER